MRFRATIHVSLKRDVADVQGMAIQQALARHGDPVHDVKVGKFLEMTVDAPDAAAARAIIDRLADGTFSNPVIEDYRAEIAAV